MTTEYDTFDDDDVIIEGSDLYEALTNIGCTDFECIPIKRSEFHDSSSADDDHELFTQDAPLRNKFEWLWEFIRKLNNFAIRKPRKEYSHDVTQLGIISELDPLLDDHSIMIRNVLREGAISESRRRGFEWPIFIVSNSILVTGTFLYKSLRIPGFIAISSVMGLFAYRVYNKSHSIKVLKKLVSAQNDIYYLYKKILKILKYRSCLKSSRKQSQRSLNNLGIGQITHLQSMCEYFVLSLEKTTTICYQTSLLLGTFLKHTHGNYRLADLITKFDDTTFICEGEITYEKLNQHFYMYVLAQSEMMQILAILYRDKPISNRFDARLTSTINSLLLFFNAQKIKLANLTEQYKSFRASTVRHELKNTVRSQFQDIYLNIDVLARKIQSVYSIVISMIDDIDDCRNQNTEAEVIEVLSEKMNEAYKEIDTARNFAEFNNLLIGKFRQKKCSDLDTSLNIVISDRIEKILPIVHDTDPQTVDEVFEEYIRDEYLKPLYEDSDFDSLEKSKLDKLLAQNFMSELKEVLIDKYKTMSEREARALLSCRKRENNSGQVDGRNICGKTMPTNSQVPPPPPPPPLPQLFEQLTDEHVSHLEHTKVRVPVPLPRSVNTTSSPTASRRRKIERTIETEEIKAKEEFFMKMDLDICRIKLPTMITNEETFIGSGENSDEEIRASSESENEES